MMFRDLKTLLPLTIILASAVSLGAAYTAQFVFHLLPCPLCLYQRVPFAVALAIGAAMLFARHKSLWRWLAYAAAGTFAIGGTIAGFHTGVEYGWWKGLSSCAGPLPPQNASIEELRALITRTPAGGCEKPAWTLFGLSMAGYNFLWSWFLSLACFIGALKYAKT